MRKKKAFGNFLHGYNAFDQTVMFVMHNKIMGNKAANKTVNWFKRMKTMNTDRDLYPVHMSVIGKLKKENL